MINFDEFVTAIHLAAESASEALAEKSHEVFERYFVDAGDAGDPREALEDLAAQARALSESGASGDEVKRLSGSLSKLSETMARRPEALRPRVVSIEYPQVGPDGPTSHVVHAPLIALVPFSGIRLAKFVFRADLDMQVDDDGSIAVSFRPKSTPDGVSGGSEATVGMPRSGNAWIELTIEDAPVSDGMRKTIEGYERALRAQIPG